MPHEDEYTSDGLLIQKSLSVVHHGAGDTVIFPAEGERYGVKAEYGGDGGEHSIEVTVYAQEWFTIAYFPIGHAKRFLLELQTAIDQFEAAEKRYQSEKGGLEPLISPGVLAGLPLHRDIRDSADPVAYVKLIEPATRTHYFVYAYTPTTGLLDALADGQDREHGSLSLAELEKHRHISGIHCDPDWKPRPLSLCV